MCLVVIFSLLAVVLFCLVDQSGDGPSSIPPSISELDIKLKTRSNTKHARTNLSSSIWCHSTINDGSCIGDGRIDCRICRFRNLCYRPDLDEYLFFHGDDTVVSGLNNIYWQSSPVVAMSSVQGLNVHHLTLTELPSDAASKLGPIQVLDGDDDHSTAIFLLMKRFKPDNLMHVFHDDLLPIFSTILSEVCSLDRRQLEDDDCVASSVRLAFFDGLGEHDYFSLYAMFSSAAKPLLAEDFAKDGRTYCFTSAIVGLSKETVWYDYGYGRPQGRSGRDISAVLLHRFAAYIVQRLNGKMTCGTSSGDAYAILVLRRSNRRILNSMELMEAIAATTGLRVVVLDPEDEISKAVKLVACSALLVGMHGATLVLSLFLKPESAILELFPYNVPSKDYAPYSFLDLNDVNDVIRACLDFFQFETAIKEISESSLIRIKVNGTLAGIRGLQLKYASWENRVRENTRTHPDWPPELGGLRHLDGTERRRIESSETPIRAAKCCSDPEWLFRIYQDTKVDIPSIVVVLQRLMALSASFANDNFMIHPGPVHNLKCNKDPKLNSDGDVIEYRVVWDPPLNLRFASPPRTRCDASAIWIQRVGVADVEHVVVTEEASSGHVFRAASVDARYHCWVSCSVDNRSSIMKWVECE